ncbi:MAG: hypothetical protein RJB38_1133 [Pseudomonadota bacterium]|jgi:DNA-binding transcriptional regulator GbsR (MarR family)
MTLKKPTERRSRSPRQAARADENNLSPELLALANLVGEFIQYWGFKHVHGRIWTLLFLSSKPMNAGELVSSLKISKALVSLTLKDLLQYQVILPAGKSLRGTELFEANPRTLAVIANILKQRETVLLSRVKEACEHLQAKPESTSTLSQSRIQQLDQMISSAQIFLTTLIALKEHADEDWNSLIAPPSET